MVATMKTLATNRLVFWLKALSTHWAWTPISRRVETALSQTATSSSTISVRICEKL